MTDLLKIRNASVNDLQELMVIENLCFPKEEAASKEALEERVRLLPDSFLVAEEFGVLTGLINGPVIQTPFITDDLFTKIKPNLELGGHQSVLSLAVSPASQKRGVATALLSYLEGEAIKKKRLSMTLTCKESLIVFYEKQGYQNMGVSNSEHGGVTWYNMVKEL